MQQLKDTDNSLSKIFCILSLLHFVEIKNDVLNCLYFFFSEISHLAGYGSVKGN